jgi:hypothetical protein
MVNSRRRDVQENIRVLERIVSVIKYLAKRSLSFRGHRNESSYTLDDRSVDHGNFLETILLISEFDVPLNSHVQKVIDKSKKRREHLKRIGKQYSRGRGNLVTMLSKSTVNKIFLAILNINKSKIIQKIGEKKFSVQMDGTQDTATVEKETIILRYVLGLEVKERLFSVQKVYDASTAGIFQLLKTNVEQQGLKMEKIIGESFDGASNIRGDFGCLQKLIRDVSPNSVYTWCYAHVLNLAATDMVENITEVLKLIGFLQSTATFFSDVNEWMFGAG